MFAGLNAVIKSNGWEYDSYKLLDYPYIYILTGYKKEYTGSLIYKGEIIAMYDEYAIPLMQWPKEAQY